MLYNLKFQIKTNDMIYFIPKNIINNINTKYKYFN